MDPHALGQLCLDRRLLTQAQLDALLEEQKNAPEWRHLGQILLERGILTGTMLANLFAVQTRLRGELPRPKARKPRPVEEPPQRTRTELDWLLGEASDRGALGLILTVGRPPAFRFATGVEPVDGPQLRDTQVQRMLAEALPPQALERLEADGSVTSKLTLAGLERVRLTVYRHRNGLALSIKTTVPQPREIAALGLPSGLREVMRHRSGLVLVTGPAGCGKSTTLASLLAAIHREHARHLLLVEDPREMRLGAGKSHLTWREVGTEVPSFAAALRAAPGLDADIVYISDLDAPDATAAALDVAQSGRLVVAGMRAGGARAAIGRILDMFRHRAVPFARDALANCLRGVVSQRLFAVRDATPMVAGELLLPTPDIVRVIRAGRVGQIDGLLRAGAAFGMISIEESLARLVRKGQLDLARATAAANDVAGLRHILGEAAGAST